MFDPEMWRLALYLLAVGVACCAVARVLVGLWTWFESFTEEPDQDARDELAAADYERWQRAELLAPRQEYAPTRVMRVQRPANDNGRRPGKRAA